MPHTPYDPESLCRTYMVRVSSKEAPLEAGLITDQVSLRMFEVVFSIQYVVSGY